MLIFSAKPVLALDLVIEGSAYEVYVNGGLVTCDLSGAPAREEQPINHFARRGVNEIEIWLYKDAPHRDDAVASVSLTLKDGSQPDSEPKTLFTLQHAARASVAGAPPAIGSPEGRFSSFDDMRPAASGDVVIGPPLGAPLPPPAENVFVLRRTIDLPMPLPAWSFLAAERLPPWFALDDAALDRLHDDLLDAYRPLWESLAARDVEAVLPSFQLRSEEMDAAHFHYPGTTQARLRAFLEGALSDPELTLAPLTPPGQWQYTLGSRGQLAALTDGEQASPILRFRYREPGMSRVLPVFFMRQADRFVVAR